MSRKVEKSEDEWKRELSDAGYEVLREKGTEPAFSGRLWDCKESGVYSCAGCSAPLFRSASKFESGTGWPSFGEPVAPDAVEETVDPSHGMIRTEVVCASCGGHLGHVFPDGPEPTGQRYCINSVALEFEAQTEKE